MSLSKLICESRPLRATFFLVLISGACVAGEVRVACPPSIEPAALDVKSATAGWTPFVAASFPLNSAAPMDGPPSQLGYLKETNRSKQGQKIITRWEMTNDANAYPEGKWIACKYGPRNEIVLARRIDAQITMCVSTSIESKIEGRTVEVHCK